MVLTDAMLAAAMQEALAAGLYKRRSTLAEVKANEQMMHSILFAALAGGPSPMAGANSPVPFYSKLELASKKDFPEIAAGTYKEE